MNQHYVHIYKIYNNKMHLPTLGMFAVKCMHFPKLTVIHKLAWLCVYQCACVINVSTYRSWCCRLWSRPDFHPGPSGDRSPACRTTWSLCPSAVVLHADKETRRRVTEKKWHMLYITEPLHMNKQKLVSSVSFKRMIYKWLICRFLPRNLILPHLKHSLALKKTMWPTCCILRDFLWRD